MMNSKKSKKLEQYGRRLCIRIKVLTKKKTREGANDVLNQVRDLFKEAEVEIPDVALERKHRISKENNNAIVRFTTFRHRALFYRNCKKLKYQSMQPDLTKSWLSLLNETRKLIGNNEDIAFCYADINCHCRLLLKNNDKFFFESLEVLKSKLSGYSNDSNE